MFRVLIVEPNVKNGEIIAAIAHSLNHTPTIVRTKQEAFALLAGEHFDYFILNMLIPLSEGRDANVYNCLGLVNQIRDCYPESVQYPIIIFHESLVGGEQLIECMEDGASSFLAFNPELSGDQTALRQRFQRLTEKALSKRGSGKNHPNPPPDINSVHRRLAGDHKLVVDIKPTGMKVFFNGVDLPSGPDGLQPRHKVFLFILARNPGKAMSADAIQEQVRKYGLDQFGDSSKNIRNKIRSALRTAAKAHPARITKYAIDTFLKTEPTDLTRLNLEKDEIFSVYGDEQYPSL